MIPTKPCDKHEVHEEHEWQDGTDTSWCEGVQLPSVRDETNRRGNGPVIDRQDF